jgi:outer membrane lipoprotein-sorting protein
LYPFCRLARLEKQKTPLGERVVDDRKAKGLGGTYRRDGHDQQVEVWVDATTGALVCIVLANPEGKVRVVMDRFILNPELPDSLFSLEPPKGYDVERRDTP